MNLVKKDVELGLNNKENDTIYLAQNGNMKAFEHLVSTYESYVYNLAYNVFNNVLDAQDVTQEIFVKIYVNIGSFKFNSKFKTWIYKVAINTCLTELKKKKSRLFERADRETIDDENHEFPDVKGKTPEEEIIEQEMRNEIREIVKNLPIKYRLPVILRDFEGLTYEEIGEALGIKIDLVKVRINRGRLKIKEKVLKIMKQKEIEVSLNNKRLMKGGDKNEM